MATKLVAWDFDGVLNRNIVDGEFVWHRDFEADLGVNLHSFEAFHFRSGRFAEVLRGERDLRDLIAAWVATEGFDLTPDTVLDYWFAKDDLPDTELVALVETLSCRQIIATNNEARRKAYIRDAAGWGARVEAIFAAGPMGVAKPDPEFFARIERWSGVAPDEILLVDDCARNIGVAQARGWQVFHFTDATRAALPAHMGL